MEYDGHKVILTNGYFDVYYPTHPNARKNGSIMLHILVAEKMLGRYLNKQEVVHHIDFNRQNNNENNLMVFATQADHIVYHQMLKNKNINKYILFKNNGVYYCKSNEKISICKICGKPISIGAKICKECYIKSIKRKVERPTRDILKDEIRNMSFIKIGQKYGVSDNAIRKWCKQYELPTKSFIIKKLNDEEWNKI